MAKKKTTPAPKQARPKGRPKSPGAKGRTRIVVTIRGSRDWEDWLEGFAAALTRDSDGLKVSRTGAIDVALSKAAKSLGLTPPPTRC